MKKLKNKRKIIIDTDPGHDDALALLLLLKSQQFDVLAVTTVAGNATIEKVTRNAQAIVNIVGSQVPVFSGPARPLKRNLVTAVVHGESGIAGFDTTKTEYALTGDAPEKIVEIVRSFPGEVTVLTLGPLTNLAQAFQLDPELPMLIDEVVMMGGAINVPGNKNRVAEFNFFVDPDAAAIVFDSNVSKTLVPLDACNDVVLQMSDFEGIKNSELKSVLLPMMNHFIIGLMKNEGTNGILVYDALAAYFLFNPDAFVIEPMDIEIESKGEHTFGMCVVEKRKYRKISPNVLVAKQVEQRIFREDFFIILNQS